ncbi:unnamed protein product [Cochlearia groenlandica]
MDKIRSSLAISTIAIILLLVIAEPISAFTVDADCYGPCTSNCEHKCKKMGYKDWTCASFRTGTSCCCKPHRKQNLGAK